MSRSAAIAARIAVAAAGVAALTVPIVEAVTNPDRLAVCLTAGFVLLTAAAVMRPSLPVAGWLGGCLTVLGGLSAFAALADLRSDTRSADLVMQPFHALSLAATARVDGLDASIIPAFGHAAQITALGGLAAVGLAAAAERIAGSGPRRPALVLSRDAERLGRAAVMIGLAGLAGAATRFVLVGLDRATPFAAAKSFWDGGSYLLLVARIAMPGFALWIAALLMQGRRGRELALPVGLLLLYLIVLLPTGQRTFAFESSAVVGLAFLVAGVGRSWGRIAIAVMVGGALFVGAQAVRDELLVTDRLAVSGVVARLAPDRLVSLGSNQIASFRWTLESARYGDRLGVDRQLAGVLLKPVPRQLLSDKPEGFSEAFTRALYPEVAAQDINFAVPLAAEADFGAGVAGVLAAYGLLGLALGLAAGLLRRRAPAVLVAIGIMTIAWTGLVFLRGDAGNAAFVASSWIVPALVVAWLLVRRAARKPQRLVIDALQIPAEFSGVARELVAIGAAVSRAPLDIPLVLRCPRDVAPLLEPAFPGCTVQSPIAGSRPRWRRILTQQALAALRDGPRTVLLCPGDQGPVLTRARVVLVVYDVRRLTHPSTAGRAERWFYRVLQPLAIRRADAILTISAHSRDEIVRVARPRAEVIVVRTHPPAPAAADAAVTVPRPARELVVVGALRSYKGIEDVIDALPAVDPSLVERVRFVGSLEGRGEALMRRARANGVAERIELCGWVSDEERVAALRAGMAALCPSHHEGYGLPLAEAMALGIPVIAADIPAHREVGADSALWFPPGDRDRLAAAMRMIGADRRLREALAERARARADELSRERPQWDEALHAAVADASTGVACDAAYQELRAVTR